MPPNTQVQIWHVVVRALRAAAPRHVAADRRHAGIRLLLVTIAPATRHRARLAEAVRTMYPD